MTLALVERLDERLTPLERLEVLTDPGSLQPLRTQVRSRRMGARAQPGRRGARRPREDRRASGLLLRAGPVVRRRLAGEAHAETVVEVLRLAGRARVPGAGLRGVGGRAHAGGPGRAVRLRADLPRARPAVGPRPADIDRLRAVRRRRLLRAGADDFVIMSARAAMFLTGPARRLGGDRRGARRRPAGRSARA